jgi:hypothetical protein
MVSADSSGTAPTPTSTGSAAYPLPGGGARWLVASFYLLGTALQALEFVLENPVEDTSERVASWAEHSTRIGLSMTFGLLAVPFLIGGLAVLVTLSRRTSQRLAWVAAGLLTCAMVGLAAIHGLELAAYGLTRAGDRAAAVAVLDAEDLALPGAVLITMFLLGALFGTITLAVVTWRSPLVPRAVPVFILAFAVLDLVLGFGLVAHLVAVAGGLTLAWAVIVGYDRSPAAGGGAALPRPRTGREAVEHPGAATQTLPTDQQ